MATKPDPDYPKAVEAFERALRLDPDLVDSLMNVARVYRMLDRIDEANAAEQHAKELGRAHLY